jgi:chloramphenicol 3-O-phosphotransferase
MELMHRMEDRKACPQVLGGVGSESDADFVGRGVAFPVRAFFVRPERHHSVRDWERRNVHARAEFDVVAEAAEVRGARCCALTESRFDCFPRDVLKAI